MTIVLSMLIILRIIEMFAPLRSECLLEIFRCYQAGLLNTVFGLGAYSLLVWVGMEIYAAQAISHSLAWVQLSNI